MVVHFLSLGGLCAEQSTPGVNQILAFVVHFLVDQEVLLLRSDRGANALDILVAKELQNPHGLTVQGLHRAQQRGLLIQCLSTIGAESRRNAEGLALNERIRSGIPGGVASRLEGRTQAAGWEAGSVRLTFNQLLAGEIHDYAAVGCGGDEAVMLFGSNAGQRLEPMGIVGRTMGDSPVLHGSGNSICHTRIQLRAMIDGFAKRLINIRAQICLHYAVVKHQTTKIIGYRSTHNLHPFIK